MVTRRSMYFANVVLACVVALALAGCGMGSFDATSSAMQGVSVPSVKRGHIGGLAHGGRQPIAGALVTLWAAGAPSVGGGYGAGATAIVSGYTSNGLGDATNASAVNENNTLPAGYFDLNPSDGANSACSSGQLNYITVTSGNPGGGTNSYSAVMLALPNPCNSNGSNTGGLSVTVNEVTTVASVWALQQFMSITPGGATPWNIGAPSTNISGLTNAFATVGLLINNLATSASGPSIVASTVSGGTEPGTYYTVITPDSSRINMLADMLATCVNTTDIAIGTTPSVLCSSLFASVSTATSTQPTDTIQAAYDIATAPGGITEYARGSVAAGTALTSPSGSVCTLNTSTPASGTTGCTWAYQMCQAFVTAGAPFSTASCAQGSTTTPAVPSDFALNLKWTGYDSSGLVYGYDYYDVAVESNGNLWGGAVVARASAGYPLAEWSPQGYLLQTVGGGITVPAGTITAVTTTAGTHTTFTYGSLSASTALAAGSAPFAAASGETTYGNNLAVDTNNNAWAAIGAVGELGGAALTNGSNNFYPGLLLQVTPATVATGQSPTSAAISGSNISAVTGNGTTTTVTSTAAVTVGESIDIIGVSGTGAALLNGLQTVAAVGTGSFTVNCSYNGSATGLFAYAIPAIVPLTTTAGTVAPYVTGATPNGIAIDSSNNIWIGTLAASDSSSSTNPLTLMTAASGYTTIYENLAGVSSYGLEVVIDGLGKVCSIIMQSATGKYIECSNANTALTAATTYNISSGGPLAQHDGAFDANSNLWLGEGGNDSSAHGALGLYALTPGTAAATAYYDTTSLATSSYTADTYAGGIMGPLATSVDGVGNIFFSNYMNVSGDNSGISEFTVIGSTPSSPGAGTLVPLSPTNQGSGMPVYGFAIDNAAFTPANNTPEAAAIDRSGNLYVGSNASAMDHLVGIAAPVVTPVSSAITPLTAASITAWTISSPTTSATFTYTSLNSQTLSVGQKLMLSGFGTTTAFNGQEVQITALGSGTFTATLQTAGTAGSNTETGTASVSQLGKRP